MALLAATEPFEPSDDTGWDLRRSAALVPGRHVIRRLGDGGAHVTFLIETDGSRLAVAKLPRPHLACDVRRLASLCDEGRALRRLASPAVPRHLDTVLSGPRPHLLMEYVAGPTLRAAIAARSAARLARRGPRARAGTRPRRDRPRRLGPTST